MSEVKRYQMIDVSGWNDHWMLEAVPGEDEQVYVEAEDFDRVSAERDAALLEVDRLGGTIGKLKVEILDRNQRLTAAEQRNAEVQSIISGLFDATEMYGSAWEFNNNDGGDWAERLAAARNPADADSDKKPGSNLNVTRGHN